MLALIPEQYVMINGTDIVQPKEARMAYRVVRSDSPSLLESITIDRATTGPPSTAGLPAFKVVDVRWTNDESQACSFETENSAEAERDKLCISGHQRDAFVKEVTE